MLMTLLRTLLTLVLVLTPTLAAAQAASQPAPLAPGASLDALLYDLLKLAASAAIAVITVLLKRWLAAKVSSETLEQLTELASQGVEAAEEAAHKQAKAGMLKLTHSEKLDTAAAYVVNTANSLGLAGVAEETAKKMIESRLGGSRGEVKP